jgi:hypothetical protein
MERSAMAQAADLIEKKVAVWLIGSSSDGIGAGFGGCVGEVTARGVHVDVTKGIKPRAIVLPSNLEWATCGDEYCFFSDFEVERHVDWCADLRDDALYREAIERTRNLHKKDFEAYERRPDE